jgi:hypothetical protein
MPEQARRDRSLEQHRSLGGGDLARGEPAHGALAGEPSHARRIGQRAGVAAGLVPVVALHLVVLPRHQRAPDAVARAGVPRHEAERVAVDEVRALRRDGRAFRIGQALVDREARVLAGLGQLDAALDR